MSWKTLGTSSELFHAAKFLIYAPLSYPYASYTVLLRPVERIGHLGCELFFSVRSFEQCFGMYLHCCHDLACPALVLLRKQCYYACAMITGFERQPDVQDVWFSCIATHPLRALGALTMDLGWVARFLV